MKIELSSAEKFPMNPTKITKIVIDSGFLQAYRDETIVANFNLSIFGDDDNIKAVIELDDNE